MAANPKIIIECLKVAIRALPTVVDIVRSKKSENRSKNITIESIQKEISDLKKSILDTSIYIQKQQEIQAKLVDLSEAIDSKCSFRIKIIYVVAVLSLMNLMGVFYLFIR